MSMRAAINAKCKDCIYDNCAPGTWRQQVEGCTIQTCPLWPHRPKAAKPKAPSGLSTDAKTLEMQG